jgi:hypothetical protein
MFYATYIKIRGLDNPATVRRTEKEKLAFSLEQYRRLKTGEISRATYGVEIFRKNRFVRF